VELDRDYADDIVSSIPEKKAGEKQTVRRSLSPVVPKPPWETKVERKGIYMQLIHAEYHWVR
jgi:hypothetical protein